MTTSLVSFGGDDPANDGTHAAAPGDTSGLRTANTALAVLADLGRKTAGRRARFDKRLFRCEQRWRDGNLELEHDRGELDAAASNETEACRSAKGTPDTGPEVDRGRRGLSNLAYLLIVIVIWAINLPIGIATFQIFEEPMGFTVLLAVFADTVLLYAAHASGVTFRRSHLEHDGAMGLGFELLLGRVMFALGIATALAQAWARWGYFTRTGSGSTVGIVFSTMLMLLTFIVAVWAAWRHHHPQVGEAEKATRTRKRRQKLVLHDCRVLNRVLALIRKAFNRRRHLAQRIASKADRIVGHFADVANRQGSPLQLTEPAWLVHERKLAALPDVGTMIQPVSVNPGDALPEFPAKPLTAASSENQSSRGDDPAA